MKDAEVEVQTELKPVRLLLVEAGDAGDPVLVLLLTAAQRHGLARRLLGLDHAHIAAHAGAGGPLGPQLPAGVELGKLVETHTRSLHPDLVYVEVGKLDIRTLDILLSDVSPLKLDEANLIINVASNLTSDAVFEHLLIENCGFWKFSIKLFLRTSSTRCGTSPLSVPVSFL